MAHGPPSAVSCRAAAGYKAELEGEGQGSVVKKKKKKKVGTGAGGKKTALSFIYGPSIILCHIDLINVQMCGGRSRSSPYLIHNYIQIHQHIYMVKNILCHVFI